MTLEERVLEISERHKLSHIGSCTSVLPVLEQIYESKGEDDIVMMSGGHAHLAHLVVKEKYEGLENIEELIKQDIHCNFEAGCDVPTGSLAHSGIALGLALAGKNVHLIMTDGSLGEGEEWETLRIREDLNLRNLKVYFSLNGYTAASIINRETLAKQIRAFCSDPIIWFTGNAQGFDGVKGHYITI